MRRSLLDTKCKEGAANISSSKGFFDISIRNTRLQMKIFKFGRQKMAAGEKACSQSFNVLNFDL
jgi:hypothetical protein